MNKLFPLTLAALCLTAPASAQITSFQHIILVIQENRTPDNMFQGLCTTPSACSTQPGPGQYNIKTKMWLDKTSPKGYTNPHANPFGLGYDLSHAHSAFVKMCDLNGACAMDGAAYVGCKPKTQPCPTKPAFGYVDNSTGAVQPYLDIATSYGWGNYFFQTNQGPSYPAHQFLFGATSAIDATSDHTGYFVSENPRGGVSVGCPSGTNSVYEINPAGVDYRQVPSCFERQTLSDLLEEARLSWQYYGVSPDVWSDPQMLGIWVAPNSINHICGAAGGPACIGADWNSHVQFTQQPFYLTFLRTVT